MWKTELLVFRVGMDIYPAATDAYEENFAAALQGARDDACQEEGVRAWVESQLVAGAEGEGDHSKELPLYEVMGVRGSPEAAPACPVHLKCPLPSPDAPPTGAGYRV